MALARESSCDTARVRPETRFVPVCFTRMLDEVLSGFPLYLRNLDATGTENFRLYAGAGVKFTVEHRRRLQELGINFVHIPAQFQQQLRRDLEQKIEMVADDSGLELAVRCEIIYESSLELIDETLKTKNVADAVPRLTSVARSIIALYRDPNAFIYFFGAARHDAYPATHAGNVATWLPALALSLGQTNRTNLTKLCMGALLYDIGMAYIPQVILNSPVKLSAAERQHMQQHTEIGAQLLHQIPEIDALAAIMAIQHHERLDGSGYPRGLTFDRIHEAARMIAVVDTYDALTSFRPYRPAAHTPGAAVATLQRDTPHKFDPRIVDAWIKLLKDASPEILDQQLAGNPAVTQDNGHGRRRFERYTVNCPATLKMLKLVGGIWMEKDTLKGIAHNLSRGGLGFMTQIQLQPGEYIRARLKGKDGSDKTLAVMVVRSRDCGDGWFEAGTRFVDLEQEAAPIPNGEFVAPVQMATAG